MPSLVAAAEVSAVLERNPSFTITNFATQYPYVKPEDVEHFLDGLRKAGPARRSRAGELRL
jgi:hypothetical protein